MGTGYCGYKEAVQYEGSIVEVEQKQVQGVLDEFPRVLLRDSPRLT